MEKKTEKEKTMESIMYERPRLPYYLDDCVLWTMGHVAKLYKLTASLALIYTAIMIVYGSFMLTLWSLDVSLKTLGVF